MTLLKHVFFIICSLLIADCVRLSMRVKHDQMILLMGFNCNRSLERYCGACFCNIPYTLDSDNSVDFELLSNEEMTMTRK